MPILCQEKHHPSFKLKKGNFQSNYLLKFFKMSVSSVNIFVFNFKFKKK